MERRRDRLRTELTRTAAQRTCCLRCGVGVPEYESSTGEGRRWVRENIPDAVVRTWKLEWLAGALRGCQRTSLLMEVEAGGPWGGMWHRGQVSDVEAQPR